MLLDLNLSLEKRREWGVPEDAWVLPLCLLDYEGVSRVRRGQSLNGGYRLSTYCPSGGLVKGGKEDCVRCRWWVKTILSLVICNYPRKR